MTATENTHYGVLGVPASVGSQELKRAYRRMQRSSHPDTGGSADHFRRVQEAWAVLGHPERRAEYDRTLGGGPDHTRATESRSRPSPRAQGTRTQKPRAEERPRIRRADSHGHPGGSARLEYLNQLREWLLDPTPPTPPAALRPPVRRVRGEFVRGWARLCTQMTWSFAVGGATVALFFAWRVGILATDPAAFWVAVGVAAGFGATSGTISSVPISFIRMLRDPYRREFIRYRTEKARQYAAEQAQYRVARQRFEASLRSRPADAEALLAAPFSEAAVNLAPHGIRILLSRAIAEERTARSIAVLGPDFSIWHDLEVGAGRARVNHLLVGPQGLILIESVTATGLVYVECDMLMQDGRPASEVLECLRPQIAAVGTALGTTTLSAVVLVYPDATLIQTGLQRLGGYPVPTFVVGASSLVEVLGDGLPGLDERPLWQADRLRETVSASVRFA